jgi:hypothetical protein
MPPCCWCCWSLRGGPSVKKREGMAWRGGDPQGAGTPCEWSGRWDCLWLFLSWNTQGSCGHWLDLVIKPIAAEASGWLLAVCGPDSCWGVSLGTNHVHIHLPWPEGGTGRRKQRRQGCSSVTLCPWVTWDLSAPGCHYSGSCSPAGLTSTQRSRWT